MGLLIYMAADIYSIPYSSCDTPQTYTIGSLDSRFGLGMPEALSDIGRAVDILNAAEGKQLFAYSSGSAKLTVNFVYDQRTALDQNIRDLEGKVNAENTTLQERVQQFEADSRAFEDRLQTFNVNVQAYNNEGGVPPDKYQGLIDQENRLRAEGDDLNARARQLNLSTRDYNSQVHDLSQNEQAFNRAIQQQPEEGLYNGEDDTITVYFAGNKDELVHTLAHEFGHALGMDHVGNPDALMYTYTTSQLAITPEDRQQMEVVCREIPLPVHWAVVLINRMDEWYRNNIKRY